MADETLTPGTETPAPGTETPAAVTPPVQTPAEEAAALEAATQTPASELVTPPDTGVDEVAHETAEDGTVSYAPTGDAALDVALTFIGNCGFAGDSPAVIAAANGDFSLLEAQLATLGDKATGWQQMVALAKDAYGRSQAAVAEQVKASDSAILSVVQSAENWANIKNWAAQNADPKEKAALNAMIDAGPVQARAAALLLLTQYQKAKGTIITPANPAQRNASGDVPAADSGKLSPRDYALKVAELHRKLGTRMETSDEYAALRRRFSAR